MSCAPNGGGMAAAEAIAQAKKAIAGAGLDPTALNALQDELDALKARKQAIVGFIEKPKDKTYPVAFNIPFAGKILAFDTQTTGAGAIDCSHAVGATFNVGATIAVTVSGTDATSADFAFDISYTRTS